MSNPDASTLVWIGFALFALAALVLFAFALYAFPLLVLNDAAPHAATIYTVLRDGALLAARYVTHTMGLVSMAVLGGFAVATVSLAFLFLLPAVFSVFVMNNCRLVVRLEQQRTGNNA